jgi:hypothetical protein
MHDMKSKQKQSKYKRPYKDKPYTSPIKRAEVVGLHLAHKTRTEIATLTGLNRQTVSRILSQSEVETLLQTYRSNVLQMVPDALAGLHVLIRELDRQAIIETLYGSKVFTEHKELEVAPKRERTYAFTKVAFFHKFGRMPTQEEAI